MTMIDRISPFRIRGLLRYSWGIGGGRRRWLLVRRPLPICAVKVLWYLYELRDRLNV